MAQETVQLLAKDQGLTVIRELADRRLHTVAGDAYKKATWQDELLPLFRILAHPRVVDSAILEQEVAVMYNFVLGIGGRRMKSVFLFCLDMLDGWQRFDLGRDGDSRMSTVELSLAVLSKMMDCNTNSIVIDDLGPIVHRLGAIADEPSAPDDEFYRLQSQSYLRYVRQRLGLGEALPERSTTTSRRRVERTEFVLRKDLPGQLSAQGPRHDNDHADIADIKIMPTRDEIAAIRSEYLPTSDPSNFHRPGIHGRLDREFRLLREDTVGVLRDAIRIQLEAIKTPQQGNAHRQKKDGLRTFTYRNATVVGVVFDQHKLDFIVQFDQPASNMNQGRQEWWGHSRRLQPGALVSVVAGSGSVLFFTVAQSTLRTPDQRLQQRGSPADDGDQENNPLQSLSLAGDAQFAYVHLNLVDMGRGGYYRALRWYRNIGRYESRCLIEFPGVLLPSFQHTLEALQQMSKNPRLPFTNLITPDENESEGGQLRSIPPPQYAMKPGFFFDLSCLTKTGSHLRSSPRSPLDAADLAQKSSLDRTQAIALLDSLSRGLALIQGPPGTGKSFTGEHIIRVLLANKKRANLGPILCVCYTNHALDQLLEHLDDGKTKIIRIGSRSKSEKLELRNLRVVARTADRTYSERNALWGERATQEELSGRLSELLQKLTTSNKWQALKQHLRESQPHYHDELFGRKDEDDFQMVVHKPERVIERWLHGGERGDPRRSGPLDPADLRNASTGRLFGMTHDQRRALHQEWLKQIRDSIITDTVDSVKEYESSKSQCDKVQHEVDLRCLHEADVVGVTTTGLAKNLGLFQKLRSKVMLCEEAGEVLEAHTLTALLPSVEHAILIGDHLQLRPQIQNDQLKSTNYYGSQYSLDCSLFERLVRPLHPADPRLPFSSLDTQRRMHPDIAELVRSTLYPTLEDGGNVADYPEVMGMKERLFWLHHGHLEDGAASSDPHSTSHSNGFEIKMTIALVRHLVRQGSYGPDDIAVITPYLGQLFRLRREMQGLFEISVGERDLEDLAALEHDTASSSAEVVSKTPVAKTSLLKSVRVATVDNFQGEEAKVVIISLVRSNTQNKCGFLSTSNRINVLLSRAKHGMYILGNSTMYGGVPMWAKVLDILQASGRIGTRLELQCPRHPNKPVAVSEPDHFLQFSPEGGCLLHCEKRLSCGHSCISRCHSDVLHNAVRRCSKIMSCNHQCPSICGEVCPDPKFCQTCCAEDIKDTVVDFLEGLQYRDINLDEDPCLFPDCGHFVTMTNMDGIMDMASHYTMSGSETDRPVAISKASKPFSMDEVKVCPTCRGSLRNIARYGRIVRRAMLDEATKKFITWSNAEYLKLAKLLVDEQHTLDQTRPAQQAGMNSVKPEQQMAKSPRVKQLWLARDWDGTSRYTSIIMLWHRISEYLGMVRKEEQPFQRVADFVQHAARQRGGGSSGQSEFFFDESSTIQVKGQLQATALLLKCEIVLFADCMNQAQERKDRGMPAFDFSQHLNKCRALIATASQKIFPRLEIEGHICFARFCLFIRHVAVATSASSSQHLKSPVEPSAETSTAQNEVERLDELALHHLRSAREIVETHASTEALQAEIDAVEKMVNGGVLYTAVTDAELKAVYDAMSTELRGTGHWYNCVNGHPFAIGNCGLPAQLAQCPECGAPVGGVSYRPAEGVSRAEQMERLMGGWGGLRL
ncbi:NFX1-type zinc finger-containing protein 1 [Madurella mycetomatis]|uniref:NFX1-type zinc finger-containing protein 1 n=1 Tax=Madurella mycetomatis TaxID=100816 RepID=A0A175VXG9_9PEZI|nr:NFX1-type zinc finger-containing protein 1 [Madurella mycetomatis]